MDITWAEFLSLFRWAILAALVAGAVCPLVGCFLYVRRTSFYGIVLPQFAAAGVVAGFVVLPWYAAHVGIGALDVDTVLNDPHAAMNWHLAWAALFTFGGLAALAWLGRGKHSESAHVAAGFAIASAATILFGHLSATGESFVYELLRGEILAVGVHELEVVAALFGLALALLWRSSRGILLVSYDRTMAQVLGLPVVRLELVLALITGVVVSLGTLTFGPVLLFGFLVLPPLAARPWARSMASQLRLAGALGVGSALGGIALAKELDLPLGPAVVGVQALALLPGLVLRRALP
jgi:ABC-type Mn2+/Zn2+ transport system permease subunit